MRLNPFDGKGAYTKFVWATYARITSRKWFSFADVMADSMNLGSAKDLPCLVSKCEGYGELKKAFSDLVKILKKRVDADCIEIDGNNRNQKVRYIGKPDNPLEDLMNAQAIKDIRTYAQFCLDSAGFFPVSWLEYFFEDTIDLLKIQRNKKRGEQMVVSSLDRDLTNIELLPTLYEAIRDKRVLRIRYKPYDEEEDVLIFHPHLLKEYNGRWFLFGHADGRFPEFGYNLALDRIMDKPDTCISVSKFESAPKDFYQNFFKNIIGVSHVKEAEPVDIKIKAHGRRMFKLVETKQLHPSQIVIAPFDKYNDGEYGVIRLHVEVNNELIGRILQMGPDLEVIEPIAIRNIFRDRVSKMADRYYK